MLTIEAKTPTIKLSLRHKLMMQASQFVLCVCMKTNVPLSFTFLSFLEKNGGRVKGTSEYSSLLLLYDECYLCPYCLPAPTEQRYYSYRLAAGGENQHHLRGSDQRGRLCPPARQCVAVHYVCGMFLSYRNKQRSSWRNWETNRSSVSSCSTRSLCLLYSFCNWTKMNSTSTGHSASGKTSQLSQRHRR